MAHPIMSDERLKIQKEFIEAKLPTSKQFEKYGLTLVDSNDVIIASTTGELRNMILSFFKGGPYAQKKCEHCQTTTGTQYERAHARGFSRNDVALAALKRIRPDETRPIKQKEFLKAFIEEHSRIPLWYLCKACHNKYDSMA
jgi:hypothetical protein